MSDIGVRCLFRPGDMQWPRTEIVPRATSKQSVDTRNTLGQFLDATLMRPLWFTEQQQEQRITDALDTMTLAERIAIEIELQNRNANVHSFDYDPLR